MSGKCLPDCGKCCISISIKFSPDHFSNVLEGNLYEKLDKGQKSYWYDAEFILDNWIYHGPDDRNGHNYTCARYDEVTRQCTAGAERPDVCKGYPWYGRVPERYGEHLENVCGYMEDFRTVLKVVSINGVDNG